MQKVPPKSWFSNSPIFSTNFKIQSLQGSTPQRRFDDRNRNGLLENATLVAILKGPKGWKLKDLRHGFTQKNGWWKPSRGETWLWGTCFLKREFMCLARHIFPIICLEKKTSSQKATLALLLRFLWTMHGMVGGGCEQRHWERSSLLLHARSESQLCQSLPGRGSIDQPVMHFLIFFV